MSALRQLVVLSLEPWDEVKRRNQLLIEALLAAHPQLRVLFVEPSSSALRSLEEVRLPRPEVSSVPGTGQVSVLRPMEWVPDRLSSRVPPMTGRAIRRAAQRLGFDAPVLWINNHSLARFAVGTEWPTLYDITDDWLLAELSPGKRRRARLDDALLMRHANAVVVCSPALAASREECRTVVEIPNGVDLAFFDTAQPRPADLGDGPVAVYVGTLHDERLDVPLACELADALTDVHFVYVGPNSLRAASHEELGRRTNVRLLGPRPYSVVPGYLQHADAIVIPHLISPFTESLDPIKARECLAVGTPTVATPVAGFRALGLPVRVAKKEDFVRTLSDALRSDRMRPPDDLWTWAAAAAAFGDVLESMTG